LDIVIIEFFMDGSMNDGGWKQANEVMKMIDK